MGRIGQAVLESPITALRWPVAQPVGVVPAADAPAQAVVVEVGQRAARNPRNRRRFGLSGDGRQTASTQRAAFLMRVFERMEKPAAQTGTLNALEQLKRSNQRNRPFLHPE